LASMGCKYVEWPPEKKSTAKIMWWRSEDENSNARLGSTWPLLHTNRGVAKVFFGRQEPACCQAVRLSFQPLIFSQSAVFFSHNKSVNSTFNRLFSVKQTSRVIHKLHTLVPVIVGLHWKIGSGECFNSCCQVVSQFNGFEYFCR
jgi:hypothetical protein